MEKRKQKTRHIAEFFVYFDLGDVIAGKLKEKIRSSGIELPDSMKKNLLFKNFLSCGKTFPLHLYIIYTFGKALHIYDIFTFLK